MPIDYEVEYNNRARVPEHPQIFAGWERDAWRAMNAELGLTAVLVPEEYGGTPADYFFRIVSAEEFAQAGAGGLSASLFSHTIGLPPIAAVGSEELKARVLPQVLADDPDRVARFQREAEVLASLNHPNIAHLYGIENAGGTLALHCFRVDSPMKGDVSANDETRLSFQLATIDMTTRRMTVREVLYNAHRGTPSL